MIDSLDEALTYIKGLPKVDVKPGLSRVKRMLDSLGSPHREYRSVHIGGSNGKGSVLALLQGVLSPSLRLGEYVSPPLIGFAGRIKVDGKEIPDDSIVRGIKKLRKPIEELIEEGNGPTLFEAATALASWHFAESGVDLALMETGLGGRYDATRPVGNSVLSVVTSVDLEHTDILGDTIEEIATEIAGIATGNAPLVLGPSKNAPLEIFAGECERTGCEVVPGDEVTDLKLRDFNWERSRFEVRKSNIAGLTGETVELGLLGTYQERNLTTALTALGELSTRGYSLPISQVKHGLRGVSWEGRFQLLQQEPFLIVDGAHNPAAAAYLAEEIKRYGLLLPEDHRTTVVFSALKDKPVPEMLETLSRVTERFVITELDNPRAESLKDLGEAAETLSLNYKLEPSPKKAIELAIEESERSDLICITGSLYLVREAFVHGFSG
ncbi:bifunctional folylpolyglutamate synthase/dihydrofolate synthase [Candidatus Bipolaricaulota bacterium]|nr:bifunctional folylpolyglutamate synthase/dihydrofolate synthase [Candidatus Bipolaricaulota bacterium]